MKKIFGIVFIIVLMIFTCACGNIDPVDNNNDTNHLDNINTQENNNNDTNTVENDSMEAEGDDQEDVEDPADKFEPLPADRILVDIQTRDGRILKGYYYPAKVANAPVVVLMHWAVKDMSDWDAIAPWLQNRTDELSSSGTGGLVKMAAEDDDWLIPGWFPTMPTDTSFAVLIFNFGDFPAPDDPLYSQPGDIPWAWLDDAVAALEFAANLEDVDPLAISAYGASIGSDASVQSCYAYNLDDFSTGVCVGAFSLSPGDWITQDVLYSDAVAGLTSEGVPVYCLSAIEDGSSSQICLGASGVGYRTYLYEGMDHGMELIGPQKLPFNPPLQYSALDLTQEWLEDVYDVMLNDFLITGN